MGLLLISSGEQERGTRLLPGLQGFCLLRGVCATDKGWIKASNLTEMVSVMLCYLQMFARELAADWTSWGNEALRFQTLDHFIDK